MKLLHIIPSVDPQSGGPARAVVAYANMASTFADVTIVTTNEGWSRSPRPRSIANRLGLKEEVNLLLFNYIGQHSYKFSSSMRTWLKLRLSDYDIVHIHAAFSFISTLGAAICRSCGVPYIFRPLGTLSEYSTSKGFSVGKQLYYRLAEHKTLAGARTVHATSPAEKQELAQLLPHQSIAIVPIPEPLRREDPRPARYDKLRNTLGFMSRIHPKKNLEGLFRALAASSEEVTLTIAGEGDAAYVASLKSMAETLGITHRLTWLGFITDEQKRDFFESIGYLILPSFHENYGIAVTEALSHGCPVIVSRSVDVQDWVEAYGAGYLCSTDPKSIEQAIQNARQCSGQEYQNQSQMAIEIIRSECSPEQVIHRLEALYRVED